MPPAGCSFRDQKKAEHGWTYSPPPARSPVQFKRIQGDLAASLRDIVVFLTVHMRTKDIDTSIWVTLDSRKSVWKKDTKSQ